MNTNYLTDTQVQELNQRFGYFEFADAQGDKSRDFAQAAIEKHERMRAAAPELLAALQLLLKYPSGQYSESDGFDEACEAAEIAVAKATGEPV